MNNLHPKRMLVILAHPEDKFAALSSLLTRYVARGVQVVLLCAACDKAGGSALGNEAGFQRTAENLGIEVYSLGYSTDNLATVDPCMLLESVTCWIDLVKPQLIITTEPEAARENRNQAILSKIVTRAYDECCQRGLVVFARPAEQNRAEMLLTVARGTRDTQDYPDWFENELVEGKS